MSFCSAPPPPPAPATIPNQDIAQTLLQIQNTLGINVSATQAVSSKAVKDGNEIDEDDMSI